MSKRNFHLEQFLRKLKICKCSAVCNRGERTRTVICMKKEADKWIQTNKYNCDPAIQPASTEACNTQPCKPEWFISDWNEVLNYF
jgi:hypothetical protein